MNYFEYQFTFSTEQAWIGDVLPQELAELGFESFEANEQSLRAYVSEQTPGAGTEQFVADLTSAYPVKSVVITLIPGQNWNAVWESNFEPVIIDTRCLIKAPFHTGLPACDFEIVIEPKMSFGTGHHATTSQMIEQMLDMDFEGKTVLDMGCGTAVLAILAEMKGARELLAIDIDEWPVENSIENAQRNHCTKIKVEQGDVSAIGNRMFDVVLANINRNIILQDIDKYAAAIHPGGYLLTSGFYAHEIDQIADKAAQLGLQKIAQRTKNDWAQVTFVKA